MVGKPRGEDNLAARRIALLDEIKESAPVSANRTQSVLVTLFNWAVEDQLLDENPLAGLRKRAVEKAKQRVLSEGEVRVLWRALEAADGTSTDIAVALQALLVTAARPGEIAGATQAEIIAIDDPKQARWEIPAARMKARRSHVVPLPPMARKLFRDAIARRRAQDDRAGVFASRFLSRTTLARHSLSQALKRVIGRLSLDAADAEAVRSLQANPPSPHDFRRTVATGLAALGAPVRTGLPCLPIRRATYTAQSMTNTSGCGRSASPWRHGNATLRECSAERGPQRSADDPGTAVMSEDTSEEELLARGKQLLQRMARSACDRARRRHDKGDRGAVLEAAFECATSGLPLPNGRRWHSETPTSPCE